jgi:pimeloyl-ACP methyl ester carboxylesterase
MEIEGDVTVMGLSYGGPIAIELASMDSRIKEVILVASSPSLKDVNGLRGILYRSNLLEKISTAYYKKNLGKLPATYPDFESVYELKSNKELTEYFVHCIKQTDSKMLESIIYQNKSTLDQSNNGITDGFNLDIPIFQVIGSKDEIWETDIAPYKSRFSSLKSKIIDGYEHKDAILKADLFYNALLEIYN